MAPEQLVTLAAGAFFGAMGWLVVGLYIQRRHFDRQAKNAGRAVHFELVVNEVNVVVARDHGAFQPLSRSSFDGLLPELAPEWRRDPVELSRAGHRPGSRA